LPPCVSNPGQLGDRRTDLKELVAGLIVDMTSAPIGRAILALTGDAGTHADLAHRLTADYLAPRRDALLAILREAVAGGELPGDLDLDLTLDLMLGAPTYRWLTTGRPVDRATARATRPAGRRPAATPPGPVPRPPARATVDAVWRTASTPPGPATRNPDPQ
ncbi:MAG: TetR-like C-terminal domain-containing protein, partial [Frankia sp.]